MGLVYSVVFVAATYGDASTEVSLYFTPTFPMPFRERDWGRPIFGVLLASAHCKLLLHDVLPRGLTEEFHWIIIY